MGESPVGLYSYETEGLFSVSRYNTLACFLLTLLLHVLVSVFMPQRTQAPPTLQTLQPYRRALVIAHFNENLTWAEQVPSLGWDVYVSEKSNDVHKATEASIARGQWSPGGRVVSELLSCGNIGYEASAYLDFIVRHYHELPDHVAFIHGQPGEHNTIQFFPRSWGKSRADHVLRLLSCANPQFSGGYLSLADHCFRTNLLSTSYVVVRSMIDRYLSTTESVRAAYDTYFPNRVGDTSAFMCSAEFIVSRERIRRLPRAVWFALLQASCDNNVLPDYLSPNLRQYPNKFFAWIIEMLWHYLFGEELQYTQPNLMRYCGTNLSMYLPEDICPLTVCNREEEAALPRTHFQINCPEICM